MLTRHARSFVALAALALLGACADDRPTAGASPAIAPNRTIAAGCTAYSYTDLVNLINTVYGPGSPNANAALGKLGNLQHQLNIGATATAHERAWDIADFTLDKYREGAIIASESDLLALLNGILCYAGLGPWVPSVNAWIVYPTDLPQTLISPDGWAGLQLPAFPVTEPTVVSITRLPDTPSPLVTDLDKYPLNYEFGKSSATNAPFTQDVTVAVCPASGVDPSVRARLKLGHQDAVDGFEVLPPAPADFIDCTTAPTLPSSLLAAGDITTASVSADSAAIVLALAAGAPGIGGLTDSFSPLAPVDPMLVGRGGIGGTADSFRPGTTFQNGTLLCASVEAPIGSPIPAACRPSMTFATFLGTPLDGIPVSFAVELGGGQVALEGAASCGSFASQFTAPTPTSGIVRSCWNLGMTPGTNTLVATAGYGGDAVPGTYFSYEGAGGTANSATVVRFTATANPPSALAFAAGPTGNIVAGTTFGATVHVLDRTGQLVVGYNGPVSLGLTTGQFTATSVTTVNAVGGVATFTGLSITTAGGAYALVASATLNSQLVSITGTTFAVVPGAPVSITKIAGDAQVAAAGTAVAIPPRVRVTDAWGNVVPDLAVSFEAQNNGAGVTGGSQVTDAAGEAAVGSWTLLDGPNSLIAYLTGNPLVFTTFTATGTSTLAVVTSCPLGGSGDPLQYPFMVSGSSRDITQVELYLASNGAANTPKTYVIALDARLNSFANPVIATAQVAVTLTGKTSEALPTAFRFATPIAARNSDKVAFTFRVISNPDGATVNYNTGPCGLGSCKPPRGCSATQLTGTTPLPLATTRRQSVALRVLGR